MLAEQGSLLTRTKALQVHKFSFDDQLGKLESNSRGASLLCKPSGFNSLWKPRRYRQGSPCAKVFSDYLFGHLLLHGGCSMIHECQNHLIMEVPEG